MADQVSSDEVFKSLCEKLRKAELTAEERELLNAILRIVWDVTGPSGSPDKTFDPNFDGCFEPGEAALIMAYLKSSSVTMATKSVDGATVSRPSITGVGNEPPPSATAPAPQQP